MTNKKTTVVTTSPCIICSETSDLFVDLDSYLAWQNGMLIQDAFPELPLSERELLVTGTCAKCWDKMFEGEEQ